MAKEGFSIDWDDLDLEVKAGPGGWAKYHRNTITDPWTLVSGNDQPGAPPGNPHNQSVVVHKHSPGCIYVRTGAGWKMV